MEIAFVKAEILKESASGRKLVKVLADGADGIKFYASEKDLVRFRCRLFNSQKRAKKGTMIDADAWIRKLEKQIEDMPEDIADYYLMLIQEIKAEKKAQQGEGQK